jgi:Na+-driven multidrug efflux pump
MPKTRHPDLLNGNITANIIRLSLPMVLAMLFQTGFSVIDMIFVGMVGPHAIAAVSIVFPVMFFFISFIMGIGAGLTSFVARAFGAGDIEKAGRIASNGLVFGIGGRIENIAILPALGMSGAILTIVGQNYGAGKLERARQTVKKSMTLIVTFMLGLTALSLLFAHPINSIFTRDAQVIALGIDFLFYRSPFWAFLGVRMMIGAGFNGAGNPKVGLLTLLFGLFVMGLPSTLLLSNLMGLNAAWVGLSVANLTGAAAAYLVFRQWFPADIKAAAPLRTA